MTRKSLPAKTADAVADRTGKLGQIIGWGTGWVAVATVVVHALTTYREYTVLALLRALARATTPDGQAPGFWANLFLDSASNYSQVWTWALGWGS